MSVEIWLIRHGETEWSLSGAHTSTTDIPLTEHGRQRAVELQEYLGGRTFAAVFTSPMVRAKETCEIAGYGDVMQVEPGLVEWNYGESEGKTTKEMREKYGPKWSVWNSEIVGGEAVEHVGERADGVIARAVAAAGDGGQVALFAHAHILRILAARWIGLPAVGGRLFALGTGSVSVLGFERETRVVVKWNRGFEEGSKEYVVSSRRRGGGLILVGRMGYLVLDPKVADGGVWTAGARVCVRWR